LKCEILRTNFPFFPLIWGESPGGGALLLKTQARYCSGNEAALSFFLSSPMIAELLDYYIMECNWIGRL
jgi:hypothetical protein